MQSRFFSLFIEVSISLSTSVRLSCEEVEDEIELFDTLDDDEINEETDKKDELADVVTAEELAELDDAIKIFEEENSTDDIELLNTDNELGKLKVFEVDAVTTGGSSNDIDFFDPPLQAESKTTKKHDTLYWVSFFIKHSFRKNFPFSRSYLSPQGKCIFKHQATMQINSL